MSWGCALAAGLGQGWRLANWWCSLCSLQDALGVSPKFRALPLSLLGTKICPARDSFQRPLAASPGSWLFLKRQAVVAKVIWKQKWFFGTRMLQDRISARGCPCCGWVRASSSSLEGEAGRLMGVRYSSVLPFIPCARASLYPQENFGETQQPALLWVYAKDYANICPVPESSPDLSGLKEKFQSS